MNTSFFTNPTTTAVPVTMGNTVILERKRRRSGSSCSMKRMKSVGSRCFCNGKMSKTSRCR